MKLQFDPPDRPGWWWYREGPECDWWPYHVTRHVAGYLEIEDPARPSGKYRCWIEDWWGYGIEGSQWAGPIKEPEG